VCSHDGENVGYLAFALVYNSIKSHNILTMMLDMHFKSFDVVKALVERLKVVDMVTKYYYKNFMILLMDVFIRSFARNVYN
jgi:hypothetical protein